MGGLHQITAFKSAVFPEPRPKERGFFVPRGPGGYGSRTVTPAVPGSKPGRGARQSASEPMPAGASPATRAKRSGVLPGGSLMRPDHGLAHPAGTAVGKPRGGKEIRRHCRFVQAVGPSPDERMIPVRVRDRRPDFGTGCSSAWPEHLPRTEEVLGSNPSAQTNTTVALVSVAARDAVDVKARVRFPAPPQTKRCWCSTAASLTSTQRVSVRLRCTAPSDGPLAA